MTNELLNPAQRLIAVLGALLISATLFAGAAATAQARTGAFYQATLAAPAETSRTIAGSVLWTCSDTICVAPRGASRPAIMCARLVRAVGPVTAFAAGGQELSQDELDRCNAAG